MIRQTRPEDTPNLLALAEGTGVFKPLEIVALKEVLDDYHETNRALGHHSVTFEKDGQSIGFAYFAPTPMTDRTWHLYWIAVSKGIQARGVGSKLLQHVEEEIKKQGGRQLMIETSSLLHYELTRKFYLKHRYELTGVIKDLYADGDDMVVFRKHF